MITRTHPTTAVLAMVAIREEPSSLGRPPPARAPATTSGEERSDESTSVERSGKVASHTTIVDLCARGAREMGTPSPSLRRRHSLPTLTPCADRRAASRGLLRFLGHGRHVTPGGDR
jgi:hypothetical protein